MEKNNENLIKELLTFFVETNYDTYDIFVILKGMPHGKYYAL